MKKTSQILILNLLIIGLFSSCKNEIVGSWKGINHANQEIEWTFKKDGTGSSIVKGNEFNEWTYTIINNSDPLGIDMQLKGETSTTRAIYKITEDDRLVIGFGDNYLVRPIEFNGIDKQTLILNRK